MAAPAQSSASVPTPPPQHPAAMPGEPSRGEALLRHVHHRDITLLFTDIQDVSNDLQHSPYLHKPQLTHPYHDILCPVIANHQGSILHTMPDTILASFAEPSAAVQSAIALQRTLRDYNRGQQVAAQKRIRIGINSGQALTETRESLGDVMHVAARIEACALPGQILISSTTHACLPSSIPCRLLGVTTLQGSPTPIELYEVHWDERRTFQETVLLRGPGETERTTKIFALDVTRDGERLRLSAHEHWPGEEKTVKHYEYGNVSFVALQHDVASLMEFFQRPTQRPATLAPPVWQAIKTTAATLFNTLFPPAIQDKLRTSTATTLVLSIDDSLVHIPWELLWDGQAFLCRRFSMGRLVSTPQTLVERQGQTARHTLRMLIIADPQGDLDAADREGQSIQEELDGTSQHLQIDSRRRNVSTTAVQTALPHYDIVHYAGHADYNMHEPAHSSWRLADGILTAQEIVHMGQSAPLPALVFCNACQSAHTQTWSVRPHAAQSIYGLANAFLLAGAQHYIGSFWELPDQPSATLAIAFYRALAQGKGVGEALRQARQTLVDLHGEDNVVWASYVLYGDPTVPYLDVRPEVPPRDEEIVTTGARTRSATSQIRHRTSWLLPGGGLLLGICLATLCMLPTFWPRVSPQDRLLHTAYQELERGDHHQAEPLLQQLIAGTKPLEQSQGYAGLAAIAFTSGDYQRALDFAAQAEALDADIAYSHVIRGHVLLNQGKIADATTAYRTATDKPHSLPWQQAIAYDRLGRIYATQGQTSRALEHYDKAIGQYRDLATVRANKAHLLEKLGQYQEALALYREALTLHPQDPLTTMLLHEAERRQQLMQDQAKQQRIDQLVEELVQTYKTSIPPEPAADSWTSRPLTLAFLDFQAPGNPTARAGEAEFVVLAMTQALRASKRLTVIEREVLDKVLAELKFNVSDITDAATGLRKGRILVAHFLAVGSLKQVGANGLLTMRLIETETTRISTSVAQLLEPSANLAKTVEQAAHSVLQELRQTYPLQGRITHIPAQESVLLNIGAKHGVTTGMVFEVLDSEESSTHAAAPVYTVIGHLQVTTVEGGAARGRVLDHTTPFTTGSKVREHLEPR